jgi:hypothetical protein
MSERYEKDADGIYRRKWGKYPHQAVKFGPGGHIDIEGICDGGREMVAAAIDVAFNEVDDLIEALAEAKRINEREKR